MSRERIRRSDGLGRTRVAAQPAPAPSAKDMQTSGDVRVGLPGERFETWPQILQVVRQEFSQLLERENLDKDAFADLDSRFFPFVSSVFKRLGAQLGVTEPQHRELAFHLHNELFGFGAVGLYLADSDVEDLLLDSYKTLDIVRKGVKHRVQSPFSSDAEVRAWLQTIVFAPLNKEFTRANPTENAVLIDRRADGSVGPADGARVFAFTDPVSEYTGFAIRKHKKEVFARQEDYQRTGVAPSGFFSDLDTWVHEHRNIIISGATGSGKTTMVNYAAGLVPAEERIVTLEDTPELQIQHPRVLSMRTYEKGSRAGNEGDKDIPMRDLLRYSLRLKPDRIVVGEVRDRETFDMLDALNTGHAGSFTTLHSNSTTDALTRLQMMAIRAQMGVPITELQNLIGSVINIIIQIKNIPGVGRRIIAADQVLFRHHYSRWDEITDRRDITENVALRTLWRYDRKNDQLKRVTDFYAPDHDA